MEQLGIGEGLAIWRVRGALDKLSWGTRAVGLGATARGLLRLGRIKLVRPRHDLIRLRSGPELAYRYPGQFPTVLVLFGDLIDPEFAFLRAIARSGWTIADVGAAIGQFSIFAAALPASRIYALEPSRPNLVTLRRNIIHNGAAGRVTAHRVALSSHDGEARFETSSSAFMSGLGGTTGEVVRVTTLPRLLDELRIERLSVLKVNVAGHEPAVLEGALPCLEARRVDVLITLLGLASLPWYERIAGLGYRFFYFHPRRRTLHEVLAFDEGSVLEHRPWPARHIIAVSPDAISGGLLAGLPIEALPTVARERIAIGESTVA